MTSYLISMITFAPSVAMLYEIFAVELCMILTLTINWANGKCKYCNKDCIQDFYLLTIVMFACHYLRDIHSQNVHDLDVDPQNCPKANIKMPNVSAYRILHIGIVMLVLSLFINEINKISKVCLPLEMKVKVKIYKIGTYEFKLKMFESKFIFFIILATRQHTFMQMVIHLHSSHCYR